MAALGIFIAWPWLALVPAVVFLILHRLSRRRLVLAAALMWGLYAIYEYSMHRRWLCTGECNIRVDLLLLYPALTVASLVALVVAFRAIARASRAG
jgi:hypothetical protein